MRKSTGTRLGRLSLSLAMLCFTMLTACASGFSGEPPNPFDSATRAGSKSKTDASTEIPLWLTDGSVLSAAPTFDIAGRNNIVAARLYYIDLSYGRFEGKLLSEAHSSAFASNLASIALTTAATAITTPDAKTALAAMATVINGGRTAYSKEVLAEQAVQTLQGFMQSRRAEIKLEILKRMRLPYDDWPIGLALSDLQSYFRAGTLSGAFLTAAENAAVSRAAANVETNSLLNFDKREEGQSTIASEITRCFTKLPPARFDEVVQNAALYGLLGDDQEGADNLAALTNISIRPKPADPLVTQTSGYLTIIQIPDGSSKNRDARLRLHREFVCALK